MQKTLKMTLAAVMCVMLAVSMMALTVFAEETTYIAQVGENGYATVAEAVAAANGETVTLLADSAETVTVSGDLYLDLNGHTLAGLTITDGTLYGMDTTTDDYVSDEGYGKISALSGDYAEYHQTQVGGNPQRYLAVAEEDGVSFHRFYLGITHNSLQPAASGVGYKALFCGDAAVKAQLDADQAFGYTLHLEGYPSISRWKSAEDFAAQKSLSLRVNNYDVDNFSQVALYAAVQMKLADGTQISSAEQSATLKQMVETVNADVAAYSTAQIDALSAWIKTSDTMLGWSVANILQEPISYEMNAGKDLVVYTELTGNLQSITVKDTDLTLANATLANGVLTVPAASFRQEYMPSGRLTLIVTTDTEEVQYTGDFTWVIQDWANAIGGLAYMHKHLVQNGNVYTGALALGADIDLTGKNIQNFAMFKMANEFNGTFDGRNHTITGIKPAATTALFGTLGTEGVVENLKLTGAQITTYGAGVAYVCKGTLRNIYVEGTITGDGMNETSDLANFGSGLLAGIYDYTAKVDNCIVEVTSIADGLRLATAFGRMRTGMVESIFTYCNAVNAEGYTFMQGTGDVDASTWTKESFSWDYTNANFETMSELWLDPVAAELAAQLGLENPNAPKDMVLENAFDMNVTGNDLVVENTKLAGTLQSVTIEGTAVTLNATLANGTLTIPNASFNQATMPSGDLTLVVTTDSEEIEISGEFVWVLHSWNDMAYMEKHLIANGTVYTGSLALDADVDLTGKSIGNFAMFKMANEFDGTFDGRNHTITGIKPSATTGLFGTVGVNGVVKNLKLTGAQITTYGGGVAYVCKGTLENIYVQGSITADGMGASSNLANFGSGLLAGIFNSTAKVNNCIVELSSITDNLRLATAFGRMRNGTSENIFTNCYAIGATGNTFMHSTATDYTKLDFTTGGSNVNFASMETLWLNPAAAAVAAKLGIENPNAPKDMILENAFDMNVEGNDLVVENTKLTGTLDSITVVDTDGNTRELPGTLADGTLTIPAKSFQSRYMASGQVTLTVTTDTEQIDITGEFVWTVLDAASTLSGLTNIHTHLTNVNGAYFGHLALGADIDLGTINLANFTMGNTTTAAVFEGTFDGRNHTISGGVGRCLFYTVGESGVVKNLKMTGITVSTYSAPVTYICKGTLDSIYVQGSITADGMGASSNLANFGCGLLAGQYFSTASVSNCIIDVVSIADGLRLGSAYGKLRSGVSESIFANCYAIGAAGNTFAHYVDGSYVKADFTAGGSNANFATLEALIASDDVVAIVLASVFGLITE